MTPRARSSMDRIRVSEALDTGSIPVGRAISQSLPASAPGFLGFLQCAVELLHIFSKTEPVTGFDLRLFSEG